jgi:hypothetical protein
VADFIPSIVQHLPWIWFAILATFFVLFVPLECLALYNGGVTLSQFVWQATKDYPLISLVGGFLACHFWWRSGG